MPQASAYFSERMQEMFGDPVGDQGPIQFLNGHGYKLTRQWTWLKDGINTYEDMSQDEYDCLVFLVQEWDFGGLETGASPIATT